METAVDSASSEVELTDMHSSASKKTKPAEIKHKTLSKKEGEEAVENILRDLTAREEGLTDDEVEERRETFGLNALPKKKVNPVWEFFKFMWNPLSWFMELACILSIVLLDYLDFGLILFLLFANATLGYYEEKQAGDAISALEASLSPICICLRNGVTNTKLDATLLVPGDIIVLKIGDVVPADCVLLPGTGLKIDQSSLTGESLPVQKNVGAECYSGSVVKMGENHAVVTKIGKETFIGKAVGLVSEDKGLGHFQKVMRKVGYFCICVISGMVIAELIVQFAGRKAVCLAIDECPTMNNILVLIVGGIPIAMPIVLSVTMAIGAGQLAEKECIVKHFTAIEELAGMDVLCSDKTGTLTKNKLEVFDAIGYDKKITKDDILFFAALAANETTKDAIDTAMLAYISPAQQAELTKHTRLHFHPFDPEGKVAWAKVQAPDGRIFRTLKGAPQVVFNGASNKDKLGRKVKDDMDKLASNGYRSLGVAIGDEKGKEWDMIGLIPLFDPPRDDTAETIKKANSLGISVKMITGDQTAIAKETCRMLEINDNILPAEALAEDGKAAVAQFGIALEDIIEQVGGFAMVMPEDKYAIVKNLQTGKRKHVVGMTGDGVNDAPALKRADIGIAVADATDAARGAADIVLQAEGLSAIIDAIIGSRKIFQRMKNYCMYSITTCVRIVLTFGIYTLAYGNNFPPDAIVILALLNDSCMLSISKDRVTPSDEPDEWNLAEIFGTAIVLGAYLTLSTHILYIVMRFTDFFYNIGLARLDYHTINGVIYLQVSISGLATIFVTRSTGFSWAFWKGRPSWLLLGAFIFAQVAASLIAGFGLPGVPPQCEPHPCNASQWSVDTNVWEDDVVYLSNPDNLSFCNNVTLHEFEFFYRKILDNGTVTCDMNNDEIVPHLGGCGAAWVLAVWIWCLGWFIPMDLIKFAARWVARGGVRFSWTKGVVVRRKPKTKEHTIIAPPTSPIVFHSRMSLELQEKMEKERGMAHQERPDEATSSSKSSSGESS